MKVSELAQLADVTADTVRHYTRIGLLKPERDPNNRYQLYQMEDVKQLRFIQKARLLGFSLQQIATIVHHEHKGLSPCPMVRDLMSQQLPKVREQIAELQQQLQRMEQAMTSWEKMPDGVAEDNSICPLIEYWNKQQDSRDE